VVGSCEHGNESPDSVKGGGGGGGGGEEISRPAEQLSVSHRKTQSVVLINHFYHI
jgi:hypothetical protein